MNIGFYDPISERWIKPRPDPEPEPQGLYEMTMSIYETAEKAVAEQKRKDESERIWALLKQVAEGCNAPAAQDEGLIP